MNPRTRILTWVATPLRLLPGNVWGRFWWRYWEKQGLSREEQASLLSEADDQTVE